MVSNNKELSKQGERLARLEEQIITLFKQDERRNAESAWLKRGILTAALGIIILFIYDVMEKL